MTPCSPLSFNRRFGGTYRLHLQGRRNRFSKTSKQAGGKQNGFAEPISSTLKMEAICSSKTLVETQRTTRRHIPEDNNLHNHRCKTSNPTYAKYYYQKLKWFLKLFLYPEYSTKVNKNKHKRFEHNSVTIFSGCLRWGPLMQKFFIMVTDRTILIWL
jgi:hypothetical protein